MSTYRYTLKGRNNNDSVHFWKGTLGTYSNYDLMNTSHLLETMPFSGSHVPGTGYHPSDYFTTYIWKGGQHVFPLNQSGLGPRVDGFRVKILEYKGLASTKAFSGSWGHASDRDVDYALYDNYTYKGVAKKLDDYGHAVRYESTINSFGSFGPYVHKGVVKAFAADFGTELPTGYDNDYGRNRIQEWRGVPSSRVL